MTCRARHVVAVQLLFRSVSPPKKAIYSSFKFPRSPVRTVYSVALLQGVLRQFHCSCLVDVAPKAAMHGGARNEAAART